ncbi:MAG TPA: hypothetical protein VGK99_10225 [Acidobacteriota bacterium]
MGSHRAIGLWHFIFLAAALTLLVACQKPASDAAQPAAASPAATSGATTAPAASAPAPAPVQPASATAIASAQYSADPDLRCDLLEVKRVSGGAVAIKWRVTNTAGGQKAGDLAASQPKSIYYDFNWNEIYYIDPAENKKYGFLTDAEGNKILEVFWGSLPAGQQRLNWAKFPAPPATSTKISVNIPKFAPFEDVPVSQ